MVKKEKRNRKQLLPGVKSLLTSCQDSYWLIPTSLLFFSSFLSFFPCLLEAGLVSSNSRRLMVARFPWSEALEGCC